MAVLKIRTLDEDPHKPSEVLVLDTDRVVRRPWVRDADLCVLAWIYQNNPHVHTHHLSFAASALGKALTPPGDDAAYDLDILPPKEGTFQARWRGNPFPSTPPADALFHASSKRSFILLDHMDETDRPRSSNRNDSPEVEGVVAGVLEHLIPSFRPHLHEDPMAALDSLPRPHDFLIGQHHLLLALKLVFPNRPNDHQGWGKLVDFLTSSGLVLHDRPFLATRAWRTPAFDAWASTTSAGHLALGRILGPMIQNLPDSLARDIHHHLCGRTAPSASAHRNMESARLTADLRAIVEDHLGVPTSPR